MELRINDMIRIPMVRVIDSNGNMLGVMSNHQAKLVAENVGLDLVEISPKSNPPVCKIMDYGKFKFENVKRAKEEKAKQHSIKIKEVQFHPNIQKHDYTYKLKQVKEFLNVGNKVKATVLYRGREINYFEKGKQVLDVLVDDLNGIGVVESSSFEGKVLTVILKKI